MTLHRWYQAQWPVEHRALAHRLMASSYNNKNADGFLVDRVRSEHLQARFVQRFARRPPTSDPFGKPNKTSTVEFRELSFFAYPTFPQLEILGKTSDPHPFITRLAEVNDYDLSISPLTIDVAKWILYLEETLQIKINIQEIVTKSVLVSPGTEATFRSSGKNWKPSLSAATSGRPYEIDRARITIGREQSTIVLNCSAIAKIESTASTELLSAMRCGLHDSRSRPKYHS